MKGHSIVFLFSPEEEFILVQFLPQTNVSFTVAFQLVNNCGLFVFCNEWCRGYRWCGGCSCAQMQEELGWGGELEECTGLLRQEREKTAEREN